MKLENPKIEYVCEPSVDAELDWQLRVLLALCFTPPQFSARRFHYEMPLHRWFIRDPFVLAEQFPRGESPQRRIIAHLAVHDKTLGCTAGDIRIGGVAEVCVHPDFRGQKLVSRLLEPAHAWMREAGMPFGMLLGNPKVYGSNGYKAVQNPLRFYDVAAKAWVTRTAADCALVKPLGTRVWPAGEIDLRCPWF